MLRAWTDTLPHYANTVKKCTKDADYTSAYAAVYGEEIGNGECRCCQGDTVETMHHIMIECEANESVRERVKREVRDMWKDARQVGMWKAINWVSPTVDMGDDWNEWWTWVGRVPKWVAETLKERGGNRGLRKLVNKTAHKLAAAGHEMWKARVATSLAWEDNKSG